MTLPNELPSTNPELLSATEGPDVTEVVDTLVNRLRSVRATYERQVAAETDLASERDQIGTARDELAKRQEELVALRHEMASQGEAIERNSAEAERRRTALAKLEHDIQQRTADVANRERDASQKQNALREERKQLEQLKAEVDESRRNLVRRASELEQREADLSRQAAEAISGEDQAHNRQLLQQYEAERRALEPKIKEIEATAQKTQRELESKLAEILKQGEQREKELAAKLEEQESLAGRLRTQLQTTSTRHRRELAQQQAAAAKKVEPRPNFVQRVDGPAGRRVAVWLSWGAAIAFLGIGAMKLSMGDSGPMAMLFGLSFGAIYFGSQSLGRRLFFPPAIAVGLLGTTAGMWFPAWASTCELAATTWDIPLDSLPPAVAANVPLAFAVLSACLVMGLALLICTASWSVAMFVTLASVVVAGLVMFPDPSGAMRYVAALLWLTLVGTALSQWGMAEGDKTSGKIKAI